MDYLAWLHPVKRPSTHGLASTALQSVHMHTMEYVCGVMYKVNLYSCATCTSISCTQDIFRYSKSPSVWHFSTTLALIVDLK